MSGAVPPSFRSGLGTHGRRSRSSLVDPPFFIVEKNGSHRILEYIGRTTPQIKKENGKWKDLDALTIFESK